MKQRGEQEDKTVELSVKLIFIALASEREQIAVESLFILAEDEGRERFSSVNSVKSEWQKPAEAHYKLAIITLFFRNLLDEHLQAPPLEDCFLHTPRESSCHQARICLRLEARSVNGSEWNFGT
ncbi:hypothetical protein DMENIID0001_019690 [Sergentomyia squamirostris]